jgi:hypothetical protein
MCWLLLADKYRKQVSSDMIVPICEQIGKEKKSKNLVFQNHRRFCTIDIKDCSF